VITILGMVIGFTLIIAAMVLGGSPLAFIDTPSILIVLGGTGAITAVSFSLRDLSLAPSALLRLMREDGSDPNAAGVTLLQISERARREGPLSIEQASKSLNSEPFLQKALNLVIDGNNADDIEKVLRQEINAMTSLESKTVDILRRAGEVSPAMGLIGTLIGLVQMLGSLSDPSTIGPAMAVALLTTFYGAVLANMVFIPLAAKAERNSHQVALLNSLYAIGASSISREENPRRLEMLLNTILPPEKRINYFK